MYTFVLILFVIVCILLILIILLQSGKSSGMELFGAGQQNIFGGQSADMLTKITTVLAILFLVGTVGMAMFQARRTSLVDRELQKLKTMMPQPEQQAGPDTNMLLKKTNK
ncbi:MAG: preprotein translocase subunit SecG [bacterium]|nr:preprotein translocase subunit SecG [bacterium]